VRNEAFNGMGLIEYCAGMSRGQFLPSGKIATIRFRAKATARATTIEFLHRPNGGSPNTSIQYYGKEFYSPSAARGVRKVLLPIWARE
jgi:hypothetical protein